jgi:hexosaminidase
MKAYLVWLPFVTTLCQGCVAQSSSRGIPTVKFNTTGGGSSFSITRLKAIVVDSQFKDSQDHTLETLIPPTLTSFAQTFSEDVQSIFSINTKVSEGTRPESGTVFLTIGSNEGFVDAAGRNTSEGYAVEVSSDGIVITGASALGVWWGTRTVLQQAILGNNSIPAGKAVDSPGWSTRGIMVVILSPSSSYLTLIYIR